MKRWSRWAGVGLFAVGMLLSGCLQQQNPDDGRLRIVTTFYPMYEFTKQVAGDYADVDVLVPAGTEPHDWEPTPRDVAKVADADVLVYNGAGFESWVDSVIASVDSPTLQAVEASHGVNLLEGFPEEEEGHFHRHEEHVLDPHIWLDPVLAQHEVQTIAEALVQADPAHAEAYRQNAASYVKNLQQLDRSYREGLQQLDRREFVTNHTAFTYLAARYDLEQVPISGITPEQEPSAAELAEIVKFAEAHDVQTIFFETLASPKVAETVAREIGAETAVLNPLEGLTDEERAQGLDYVGVMNQNLQALERALSQ
ncbi:MAG TPA: metal ABC transporter substrate-binding protein [Bacilli bacterium]|nr:metal ABC transporter substrate-binding protein [Bacilli bacterium]